MKIKLFVLSTILTINGFAREYLLDDIHQIFNEKYSKIGKDNNVISTQEFETANVKEIMQILKKSNPQNLTRTKTVKDAIKRCVFITQGSISIEYR